ncbi:MAG: putative Fe-S cluster assembly protein SufT [Chlamydiae bacterium]|nr:putative Fe-S cluster assembly protein SufT [Chlamydiota bacterium]MBI3266201.1 putative Fe-S cluster assembly protein SufT [Chlamydiota bacterium]
MKTQERVSLTRDCPAIQIPDGTPMMLRCGSVVTLTQTLGGSYTVITPELYMVRIEGKDADALGKEIPPEARAPQASEGADIEKMVWDQLRTCFDPEIPINIVELGLVYDCRVMPLAEGGNKVEVKMTLTAPGCGMGSILATDAKTKILSIPGVRDADVQWVWDPPWNMSMMSEAAKLQLGF